MSFYEHTPVMLPEVLNALQPRSNRRYFDGTVGGAGHAAAILEASSPAGFLMGSDRDGAALEAARQRLAPFDGRWELWRGRFEDCGNWVEVGSVDGALLDLGVSSAQLDQPHRGFSFQHDGPLDMRQDDRQTLTAATLVNEADVETLTNIFRDLGQERNARRIARALVRARSAGRFETTLQLASVIEREVPRSGRRIHPATRVFMALRIAVNEELETLRRGLVAVWTLLKVGGRLAVITFHSLEDRVVKEFGRDRERNYAVSGPVDLPEFRTPREPRLRLLPRKPLIAGPDEIAGNPRARSAKLRVMEKLTL